MNLLLVDDLTDRVMFFIERFGRHNIDIVETAVGAIQKLEENIYDFIFLGGDLDNNGGHGYEVAEWLVENPDNENMNAAIFTHTWNFVEAETTVRILPKVKFVPFDEPTYSTLDI